MSGSTRLFVGNIPAGVTEVDLSKEFSFYGTVQNVELKSKKNGEDVAWFAFVTLQADILNVNKCVHEFGEELWRGARLNVSIARESFLEKLKREREEEEKRKQNQNIPASDTVQIKCIDIPTLNIAPKKWITPNNVNHENGIAEKKESLPVKEVFVNIKVKESPVITPKSKLRIEPVVTDKSSVINNVEPQDQKKLTAADERRIKSIQNMRTAYNEKKSLIKIALSSVDKKVNKIIFDEDGGAIVKENGDVEIGKKKTDSKTKNKRKHNEDSHDSFNESGKIKNSKKALFDNDDEDSEDEINFDVKEQFQGEAGQKLMELQTRYKSDKRFMLDERFIDDTRDEDIEGGPEPEDDQVDSVEVDEKTRQYEILQGILGTDVKGFNKKEQAAQNKNKKMLQPKIMLRYDPTRPDHDKYMSKPVEKPEGSKKKSKKEKKLEKLSAVHNEKERPEDKPAPEVSKERYYKVNESLKQVMKEEKQPFSLLSLFGKREEEDDDNLNDDKEYSTQNIEKNSRTKNPLDMSNPFKYDSDTDEEQTEKETKQLNTLGGDELLANTLLVKENFFFAEDDPRLKEGLNFFLNMNPSQEKSREELKFLVKRRIQNNLRNEKSHFKKVQQRHPPKTTKFRRK